MTTIEAKLQRFLLSLVQGLVDQPDEVKVTPQTTEGATMVVLTVKTAEGEMGKVIGKQGRLAKAIRVLVEAVASKHRTKVVLEIDDPKYQRTQRLQ